MLIGSLATRPYELAADYINDVHDYYTGGIYWIPGYNTVDITIASLEHMKQVNVYYLPYYINCIIYTVAITSGHYWSLLY